MARSWKWLGPACVVVALLAVVVDGAAQSPSAPRPLVEDTYARLRLLGLDVKTPDGTVPFSFLTSQIERVLTLAEPGQANGLVDPTTGEGWVLTKLLRDASGSETWLCPRCAETEDRPKERQIRAVLDLLVWRLARARFTHTNHDGSEIASISRAVQVKTQEKCNPVPNSANWTASGGLSQQFAGLFTQALAATNATVVGTVSPASGVSASGPAGSGESEASVGIAREVIKFVMPSQPFLATAPIEQARVVVESSPYTPPGITTVPALSANARQVPADAVPAASDFDAAGTDLGTLATMVATGNTTNPQRGTFETPLNVVLDAAATQPRFTPAVMIRFAGEEPPHSAWPPTTMGVNCSWGYGRFIAGGKLIYRQRVPRLGLPALVPPPPVDANPNLAKQKAAAAEVFNATYTIAQKGLVGALGEKILPVGGGKAAEKTATVVALGLDKKIVPKLGEKATKLVGQGAAVISIVTNVVEISLYITAYVAHRYAADPPRADFDVVAPAPQVAGAELTRRERRLPRAVRRGLAAVLDNARAVNAQFGAYLISFERLQGAVRAGAADAVARQAAATTEFGRALADRLEAGAALRRTLAAALRRATRINILLRPRHFRRAVRGMRRRGFTAANVPLERFGLAPTEADAGRGLLRDGLEAGVTAGPLMLPDTFVQPRLAELEGQLAASIRSVAADPVAFATPP